MDTTNGFWSQAVSTAQKADAAYAPDDNEWVTFASTDLSGALELDQVSVGVITQALENISYCVPKMVGYNLG